jgi:hypothetical protein
MHMSALAAKNRCVLRLLLMFAHTERLLSWLAGRPVGHVESLKAIAGRIVVCCSVGCHRSCALQCLLMNTHRQAAVTAGCESCDQWQQ